MPAPHLGSLSVSANVLVNLSVGKIAQIKTITDGDKKLDGFSPVMAWVGSWSGPGMGLVWHASALCCGGASSAWHTLLVQLHSCGPDVHPTYAINTFLCSFIQITTPTSPADSKEKTHPHSIAHRFSMYSAVLGTI